VEGVYMTLLHLDREEWVLLIFVLVAFMLIAVIP
jgi:hypothetical protein